MLLGDMGSALGVKKLAAARIGVSLADYQTMVDAGDKWCTGCKAWHSRSAFNADKSRSDGLAAACPSARKTSYQRAYQPRERRSKLGAFFAETRDGDRLQARARVNHRVKTGMIPAPSTLPCSDCGHVWTDGDKRHEYDHYLGYSAEHQLSVQAVCVRCHRARDKARREKRANG